MHPTLYTLSSVAKAEGKLMFKVGDKVLVKINWKHVTTHPGACEHAKSIDGLVGEVDLAECQHKGMLPGGQQAYVIGYGVVLMNGTRHNISAIHLIKIDDDDATPDQKAEWKPNDVWTPSKLKINYKKVLTASITSPIITATLE